MSLNTKAVFSICNTSISDWNTFNLGTLKHLSKLKLVFRVALISGKSIYSSPIVLLQSSKVVSSTELIELAACTNLPAFSSKATAGLLLLDYSILH